MKGRSISFLCPVVLVISVIMSGCSTDIVSIGVEETPTPQAVDRPLPGVHRVAPAAGTTVPARTTVPAPPEISQGCRDLAAASDADRAFIKTITDRNLYANLSSLEKGDCSIYPATMTGQMISRSPKPESPLLADAREKLMSAASWCLDPENTATRGRIRDDLDSYVAIMSRYAFMVSSCGDRYGEETAMSLKKAVQNEGEILLRGTGPAVQSFNTVGSYNTTFAFSCTGSSCVVMLQSADTRNIGLIANCAGSCEGKRSIGLNTARYSLNVSASGPWSVLITPPY